MPEFWNKCEERVLDWKNFSASYCYLQDNMSELTHEISAELGLIQNR